MSSGIYMEDTVRRNRLYYSGRGYDNEKIDDYCSTAAKEMFLKACDRVIDNSGIFEETKIQLKRNYRQISYPKIYGRNLLYMRSCSIHERKQWQLYLYGRRAYTSPCRYRNQQKRVEEGLKVSEISRRGAGGILITP